MQLSIDIPVEMPVVSPQKVREPGGYKRLYGFHKYWGKKPHEPIAYAIEQLTDENDIVMDPFVGSGTIARETLLRGRRFVGFDINPIAVELTKLIVSPPNHESIREAFGVLQSALKTKIFDSYQLQDGRIASHFLWDQDELLEVWVRGNRGRRREELAPSSHDLRLVRKFDAYESKYLRKPKFFSNSRINAHPRLTIADLLTGRAQRNLDWLIEEIDSLPHDVRKVMKLCLTSASGQMTKMVFAISKRGKTTGDTSNKKEVGSWVVGFWRPKLHFEVNVWNCFERRVNKLVNALKFGDPLTNLFIENSLSGFIGDRSRCYVECVPCQDGIMKIEDETVDLILTDPPHSDRIPYLELSELWNSILGVRPSFDDEIVVSNAKERSMGDAEFQYAMGAVIKQCARVLRADGHLLILYNARLTAQWEFLYDITNRSNALQYVGRFPCTYSAGSVVQDNRQGALKGDHVLVFGKPGRRRSVTRRLRNIEGWCVDPPTF